MSLLLQTEDLDLRHSCYCYLRQRAAVGHKTLGRARIYTVGTSRSQKWLFLLVTRVLVFSLIIVCLFGSVYTSHKGVLGTFSYLATELLEIHYQWSLQSLECEVGGFACHLPFEKLCLSKHFVSTTLKSG